MHVELQAAVSNLLHFRGGLFVNFWLDRIGTRSAAIKTKPAILCSFDAFSVLKLRSWRASEDVSSAVFGGRMRLISRRFFPLVVAGRYKGGTTATGHCLRGRNGHTGRQGLMRGVSGSPFTWKTSCQHRRGLLPLSRCTADLAQLPQLLARLLYPAPMRRFHTHTHTLPLTLRLLGHLDLRHQSECTKYDRGHSFFANHDLSHQDFPSVPNHPN